MQNFITAHQINYTATAAASSSAEDNTSAVDTQGFDSVTFIRSTSAARILKLQGGATATSATNDLSGASVTATAGALVKLEVHRPTSRFIRLTTVTGAASVLGDCVVILGRARTKPATNTAYAIVATPTEG